MYSLCSSNKPDNSANSENSEYSCQGSCFLKYFSEGQNQYYVCQYDDDEIVDIPAISEIVRSQRVYLCDSFKSEQNVKADIDGVKNFDLLFRLIKPVKSQYNRIEKNADYDRNLKLLTLN